MGSRIRVGSLVGLQEPIELAKRELGDDDGSSMQLQEYCAGNFLKACCVKL